MKRYVPSVTEILRDLAYIDLRGMPVESLETARNLGISLHEICAEIAKGKKVDVSKYEGPLRKRAEAFIWWLENTKAKVLMVEHRLTTSYPHPHTGRPDLVVRLGNVTWVIDIKSSKAQTWQRIQLAAYEGLLWTSDACCLTQRRGILSLDGTKYPKLILCYDQSDRVEWHRALRSWWWRYQNGLIVRKIK